MQCDDIQEHLVASLYDECGSAAARMELQEHLRTCSACRKQLEELGQTRKFLQLWKDEAPLRKVSIPEPEVVLRRSAGWQYLRHAAIAAMALITFLALSNTQIVWNNKEGFSFSTHIFPWRQTEKDYYTKAELRSLMKQAFDDSEYRITETNYLMMQKLLDMVEQDRLMDWHFIRGQAAQNRNNN